MYFVIRTSADGISIEQMSKDVLEQRLAGNYWGQVACSAELPKNSDPECWTERLVIIKGEIVVPEAIQKVIEYRVP